MSDAGRFGRLQAMPPIAVLMTPFPHSVAAAAPLDEARRMMAERGIRHLPVKRGEVLAGVVSDRDLELAAPPSGAAVDEPTVGDIAAEAYVVDLATPADEVLAAMAERHLSAALVVKQGRLAGIFTLTDACRGFEELLQACYPSAGGGGVA